MKYYIYVFEKNGINGVSGLLEYPLLRKTDVIILNDSDREILEKMENEILEIIESDICPHLEKKSFCKSCSYYEFCFCKEIEE